MTISKELEATLQHAISEARRRRHEYLTVEHLLLALLADPVASRILASLGVNLRKVAQGLEEFFREHLEPAPGEGEVEPKQTPAFWRVLQRAAMHVQGSGKAAMDGGNVLVALFREPDSHAISLLQAQGVGRLQILRYVAHGITPSSEEKQLVPRDDEEELDEESPEKDPLEAYTVNLVAKAARGGIDPLIGRANELERMVQVLCRRRKNNPVLVGDPGVGKTAIVEGLARAIHEGSVPAVLSGATVYALDMGAVLAGTKFRGQFEERLKNVIKAIQKDAKAILFIDEIHTIVGAGATSGGSMDASNLLKPALAAGELRCIGSTTFQEYKSSFERDRALGRRFQKIEVVEPSVEDTIRILQGLRRYYEEHHAVAYTDEALEALGRLEPELQKVIYGQDQAIEALAAAIKLARAGLGPAERPIGSFLFSGPTGVGKTELAKQLARILQVEFLRFDMSEYMEKHTVSRLIGAPPGYVGFDQGGLLTDAIRKTPHALLLLDEIEKAHPDVFNVLLQVMDHATLTDNNGRKADFRHVVLVMTTNAGARDLASRAVGFAHAGARPTTVQRSREAIERAFSPEFRNRLDAWVVFEPLGHDAILRVVDKLVGELRGQLAEKDVVLEVADDAREWLAEKGFDPAFGARPMGRLIANEIKKPLAELVLFGPLKGGGKVVVSVLDGRLQLKASDPQGA